MDMSDSNKGSFNNNYGNDRDNEHEDLTSTQEYLIAGGVILLFGLLYWFINHGWNSDADLNIANTPLPELKLAPLDNSRSDANAGLQGAVLGSAAVSSTSKSIQKAPVNTDSVQAAKEPELSTPAVEQPEMTQTKQANSPNFQVKANPKTSAKLAEVAQLKSAEQALKATEAETNKAAEEAKAQAEAVSELKAVSKPEATAYTLPDGTEVTLSPDGFESDFKQLIENKEINKPISFDSIYFDTGSIKINAKSDHQIKATAALLHKHRDIKILLRGHTDNTGFHNTNIQLSLLRANAMGVALGRLGIDTRRIQVTAMGASYPIASNDTEEGRKQNRRIEVLIIE